ncbi:MAG: FliM/FliN family flagellar motor switch protein [Armatimonadetes bacterium]|nr:FliM/FliN family flagellar motor switch protein [Armatimonadota bacterium]
MADMLNQDEINALMETFKSTGGQIEGARGAERQVKLYDFARPDKFSKDHLRSLNSIHSKHGASFAAALAALLRVQTRADLLALDQLMYREYCASVPDGTLFVEVELKPLTSTAIFEFNPVLVSTCVDLLAGGSPVSGAASAFISDIDKAIVKPIVELALKQYHEAWACCLELKPTIVSMSTESTMRQILLPSEAVLVCGYEVSLGESVSMMSICLPASAIEPVLPALTLGRTLNSMGRGRESMDPALMRNFEEVALECRAVLGRAPITLGEIADLEVGDLIRLPTRQNGCAELWVGEVAAFAGVLGLSGKNIAIKIAGSLDGNAFGSAP